MPQSEELRNTREPYTLVMGQAGQLSEKLLKNNIDKYTLTYKDWHFPKLKLLSFEDDVLKLANTNYNITYELTLYIETTRLHVACNCDRRTEMLCHHAYYALEHIISTLGCQYFRLGRYTRFREIGKPAAIEKDNMPMKLKRGKK